MNDASWIICHISDMGLVNFWSPHVLACISHVNFSLKTVSRPTESAFEHKRHFFGSDLCNVPYLWLMAGQRLRVGDQGVYQIWSHVCCTRPVDNPHPWMISVTSRSCYPSRRVLSTNGIHHPWITSTICGFLPGHKWSCAIKSSRMERRDKIRNVSLFILR